MWKALGPDLENELPCKTQWKLDRSPHVLDLLSTFPQISPGHFSWGRLRGLTCKMSSPTRPSKNYTDHIRRRTCFPLIPKVPWAPLLWKASGLDLENFLLSMTQQKLDRSLLLLGLLSVFSPKSPELFSCGRRQGLTWKMSFPARPSCEYASMPASR